MPTCKSLANEIREALLIPITDNAWFTRSEMSDIIRQLDPEKWLKIYKEIRVESGFRDHIPNLKWRDQHSCYDSRPGWSNMYNLRNQVLESVDERRKKSEEWYHKHKDEKLSTDTTFENSETENKSLLSKIPNNLLDRAKEILITQDNITISIKL